MFRYTNRNRTKRRRVMARKLKPELHRRPQIFENSRFYIHPYFINGSRRKVLHELIVKYGGSYTLVLDDETTHILVDEDVSSGKFWRSLGEITLSPNVNVLIVSWLSASVRAGRCLNPVDYEIRRPRFETSHRCAASTSTAVVGTVDNECVFSDTSSSSAIFISEDADVELPYLEAAREEASTYDDGKYDEETSCDDEWIIFIGNPESYDAANSEALNAPGIVNSEPSDASGIVNTVPDASGIINSGPSNTSGIVNSLDVSGIVNSEPSNTSGIVNSLDMSGIVNSGPLDASGIVNSGPSDASGIVNSGPSDASGILNSGTSDASGILNSGTSDASGILNSGPSDVSGILNSGPPNTPGIVNSCTPNSCATEPAPNCKKRKLEDTFPSSRPDTLAARLSRVRVRRIPEHLREPGGRAVIVDLNGDFSQPSGKNVENDKIINNNYSYVDLNRTETNGMDKKFKVAKETEGTLYDDKNFGNQSDNYASVHKFVNVIPFEKPNTESSIEASEDKSKKSITVFSLDEQFDAESVNEVSQVVTMIVESVCEVAVNEKIINESVVEISKNAMENVDSTEETLKNENIYAELVSDVLLRVVEDVVKAETDSKIKKVKFESLSENFTQFSEMPNVHDVVKIPVDVSKVENTITLEDETQKENNIEKLAKSEPSKNTSQENTCTELVEVESAVSELPVPQLPINSNVSAYPVQLFCSTAFEFSAAHQNFFAEQRKLKSVEYITADICCEYFADDQTKREPAEYMAVDINLENYSNDQTKQESVEYITADLPSNLDSLECEAANISDASYKIPESEIVHEKRSCKRPDITGPDIFFPFPIPRSSLHSRNSNNRGPSSLLSGAVYNPNREIIKKLQLLYESFKRSGEKWRMDVYEKAILALTTHTKKIESLEGIRFLSCISKKIAKKVLQISETGHLEEIDEICNRPSEETRKAFSRAWGIGPRKARELYREGFDTLADLRTKASLSPPLLVGLKYYDELNTKMPWKEARSIYLKVLNAAFAKYPFLQGDACSSLRRRKKFCGHVSVLLRLPVGYYKNDHKILPDVVAELHKSGYVVDDLIRHEEIGNQTKYAGIFRLGRIYKFRRIEITVCIHEEYGCALMFLTGSSYFNRAIQQFALKRNMLLDGHSLRLRILNEFGGTADCPKLYAPTEEAIFQFLMLNYIPPEKRERFVLPTHL
ncbi:uncharacterized protein LOC129961022 [Argiope bruennichi]|uniref:uncharacterized protein LOC129961022 n=1 Tax=Argiope bruennichi TaxID=94029 RepID=UPI0024942ED5|nr:uncharacterized protein LOC129961022 [Argiope bruennichi]